LRLKRPATKNQKTSLKLEFVWSSRKQPGPWALSLGCVRGETGVVDFLLREGVTSPLPHWHGYPENYQKLPKTCLAGDGYLDFKVVLKADRSVG